MRKLLYAMTIVGLLAIGLVAQQAGGAFLPGADYTVTGSWTPRNTSSPRKLSWLILWTSNRRRLAWKPTSRNAGRLCSRLPMPKSRVSLKI